MKVTERHAVSQEKIKQELSARLGPAVEFDRKMAEFTSFQTGGPAGYFYTAAGVDDVIRAVRVASELNLPRFILGGGTNLLVSDKGYGGLVIRVDVRGLDLVDDLQIDCGAGEPLSALVAYSAAKSLSGLEFAAGIWGTVGGAVCGNAGAYGGDMGSTIVRVTLVDPQGELKEVAADYCRFGYRDSHLKSSGDVIIEVRLKLKKGDPEKIRSRVEEIMTPFDELIAVHPDDELYAVMQQMTEERVDQLPVVKDGQLMGMIARDNLVGFLNARAELGA